ncbi:MAG: PAS domain-containing protein [Bacteroidota bacterium]
MEITTSEAFHLQDKNIISPDDMVRKLALREERQSSLGKGSEWPFSLRNALDIMHATPFPLLLSWGKEYHPFYNSSFIALINSSIEIPLNETAIEVLVFETWKNLTPAFEEFWNGNENAFNQPAVNSENIYESQTFSFSFRLSPVYKEDGMPGGVLLAVLHFDLISPPINGQTTGTSKHFLLTAQDVTSLVNEKNVLQQSEQQYRNLVMQSGIATATLKGKNLEIALANDAFYTIIGEKAGQPGDKTLLEIFTGLEAKPFMAAIEKVFSTGNAFRQNEIILMLETGKDIKQSFLDLDFAPLYGIDNTVTGIILTINDVTEKVKSRQLIEDAEQRSRLAIEASNMGTFDWDLVAQQFVPSKRLLEIFGFAAEETVTHAMLIDSFHPADKSTRDAALQGSFLTGSLVYEARIIKPDKNICWVKVYGKIVYNELRKPMRMHGTVTDITLEKTTWLALEESESRLNIAISAASLGTYDVDIESASVLCSPRIYEIFDFPEGSRIRREDILKIIYPEDLETRNKAHENAMNTGKVEYESRIVWRDQSIHWIRVNARILFDENRKAYRILGTVMDITEQKFYFNQLKESEQRFKAVADTAPVMIWMSGTDMLCFFFNKGWLNFTGRTIEEEVGNGWVSGVHPDDVERCFSVYTNAFEKREEFYMEYRLRMNNGQYHWISDNGVPRFTSEGIFLGYIGGCMDIDERKRQNEQLTISEARLRIAAISGELGTWDYNPETDEFYWDDASAEMVGVPYQPASTADKFWSVVHPDDHKEIKEKERQSLDPVIAANFDHEFRIIEPSTQQIKWISAKGKAFFKNGKPYRFAGTAIDITEKKVAIEALRESELLFKTIANTSPVGLWLTNELGINTFINNTWIEWTGMPFEEQMNAGWTKVVLDEDKKRTGELFWTALQKREKFSAEFRFLNKKNEVCWCLSEGFPFFKPDGSLAGYAGSVTDITDQLKGIDALKKSEERFRLLANSMPQFIWTSDINGILNYFNQSVYEYTGIDPKVLEEPNGWLSIVHPEDREENINRWLHAIETGEDFFLEHRFRRNDGAFRWQLSRAVPQKSADGTIQMWIGTSTDIHDQKLISEELENKVRLRTAELQKVNEEVIQQKEFVEIVLDSSLILVTVFDIYKNIISFNKKCETVFGLRKENVIGKAFHEVFPGIELSQTYKNLQRAIEGETFHVSSYKSVIDNHYYESYFAPLRDRNNNVYAVLMTAHDITDIVQSTEKLKQAYSILEEQNKALERSNQELESFSYVASHDLQEPLRKIQTFIELLHRNLHDENASEKYFEKITSSAQRMAALIRDVLNYSRLAKQGETFVHVHLNSILENVKTDFELLITEKKARFIYNNLPVIKGSPLQLHQLFTNLISNSLKFSNEDAPIISISYRIIPVNDANKASSLQAGKAYHYIIFSDNGIGFEQQFAEKIFAIFQRLNNRQFTGTGIGLALCKKIVENHNGIIEAVSQPGKGASFHIYLPCE